MRQVAAPTLRRLQLAYRALMPVKGIARRIQAPSSQQLIVWASWARIDARLGELLVAWLARNFRDLRILELAELNRASPCPQALMAIFEFVQERVSIERPADLVALESLSAALGCGIRPAPLQMFFVNDGKPHPQRDLEIQQTQLQSLMKWGFIGNESLVPLKLREGREANKVPTTLSKASRLRRLDQLIAQIEASGRSAGQVAAFGRSAEPQKALTVADYLEACQFAVHRRTAERDLVEHPRLRAKGFTRSRRFFVVD